jgi:4-hydroxy-3-polyprenylbenzoate decarboxylase
MDDVIAKTRDGLVTQPRLDLQEHIADLEAKGLLTRIDHPVNKDTELHPLVRLQFIGGIPEAERRAFLFTNVVDSTGRKYDMPVVVGSIAASAEIYSLGMRSAVEDIGRRWMDAIAHPVPPIRANAARCQEVVIKGDDLRKPNGGLKLLPVPVSTPGFDSAPYISATFCVTRDPDSGIQNGGTYRAALKATDRCVVRMVARPGGAGGYLHWEKYNRRKQPMPIAIVVGAAPVVLFTGAQKLDVDLDEIGVAGALAGRPIPMVKCATIDIDVPADAEIVIEGLIDPEKLEPEAPFGESNGYVALEAYNMPVQVTAITHRRNPVFASIISQVTPSESSLVKKVAYEPVYLAHLKESMGVRGVRRVVMHEPLTNLRPVIFVQYAAGTPRSEVWRGMHGAASLNAIAGKIIIAVSEDIDPDNLDAVMWAIAYRCNPVDDVQIPPYHGGVQGAQYGNRGLGSKLLIDATMKGSMPPLALPKKEFMERAQELWALLGLPPVTLKQPWHGYELGDWIERWDTWATRAVSGRWEETGKETLARQKTGLRPETPARKVPD